MKDKTEDVRTSAPTADEDLIERATQAVEVQSATLAELGRSEVRGEPLGMAQLMDVPVRVTVEVGRTRMPLGELVRLGPGSLVTLDREAHEPVDVLVNGKVVAHGEIVTLNRSYGVRITQVNAD